MKTLYLITTGDCHRDKPAAGDLFYRTAKLYKLFLSGVCTKELINKGSDLSMSAIPHNTLKSK